MDNPSSQRLSPIQVPELLRHILSFLDQTTLHTRICLVSWTWYLTCKPLLAHKIVWDDSRPLEENKHLLSQLRKGGVLHWKEWLGVSHFPLLVKELERLHTVRSAIKDDAVRKTEAIAPLQELTLEHIADPMNSISQVLPSIRNLTRLCLVVHEKTARIDVLLIACPQLTRLELKAGHIFELMLSETTTISSFPSSIQSHWPLCGPCALESLHLVNTFLYPAHLLVLLSKCPSLHDLRIIRWVSATQRVAFRLQVDEFLASLASLRLSLRSLHLSMEDRRPLSFPQLQQLIQDIGGANFSKVLQEHNDGDDNNNNNNNNNNNINPNTSVGPPHPTHPPIVTEWSFLARDLGPRLSRPDLFPVPSVITTLELLDGPRHYSPGSAFHAFLCAATHLQVLKAPSVQYLGDDLMFCKDKGQALWACRQLRVLHLGFCWGNLHRQEGEGGGGGGGGGDPMSRTGNDKVSRQRRLEMQSRTMFGYLSKVCPKLEELVVRDDQLQLSLAGGLCLLSRLERLEKLEVQVRNFGLLNGMERGIWALAKQYQLDLDWMRLRRVPAMEAGAVSVTGMDVASTTASLLENMSIGCEEDPMEGVSWREWTDVDSGAYSQDDMQYLGSLEDVRQCLHTIYPVTNDNESKNECWPHLQKISVEWHCAGLCEALQRQARRYRGLP